MYITLIKYISMKFFFTTLWLITVLFFILRSFDASCLEMLFLEPSMSLVQGTYELDVNLHE